MKRVGLVVLLLLGLTALLNANPIQLNTDNEDLLLVRSSLSEISYTYGISKIDVTDLKTDNGDYSQLIISNTVIDGKVGNPGLPVRKKLIEIPWEAKYSIKIKSYTTNKIKLEGEKLYPVQPSIAKNVDVNDIPFEINNAIYNDDNYNTEKLVSLEEVGIMRGVRIARLVINPVKYNPVSNTIQVINDIEFNIELSGSNMTLTEYNKDKAYSPYYEVIYNRVNRTYPNHDYPSNPDMRRYPIKYLIVANRMFENTLQQFIEWKTKKGFEVIADYTDTIGSSATEIKNWLQSYYDNATPTNPAPSFALIVGDVAQVTEYGTGSNSNKGTDLYYYCYDGGSDYIPDIYYGRWSVTTTTELQNIIDKTLYYEQYQFTSPSYLDNVTLIAGEDSTWNPNVAQATIQYGMNQYFNSAHGYANVYDYLTSYSGCYDTMNSGVGFINYTAHGSTTSWSGPSFSTSNISSMTNTGKYPFAIGNCCVTGQYAEVGTCFAEQFIRVGNKGAYSYIGSAPNTYWFEDFYWSVGAFPISGDNNGYVPTYDETSWGAYDGPFMTDYVTTDATKYLGNLAVTEVHAQNFPTHSSDIYYWQAYMLFGDPSIVPYWSQGTVNTYSTNAFIPISANTFTVNAEPGSYVAISQNGELHGAALVGSTGTVDVPIVAFSVTGTADLVITKPQRQPVVTTLPIQPLSGPYISIEDVIVSAGDDNIIASGETVYLTINLENVGTSSASSVVLNVNESDSYISLIDSNQSFGTIASGATVSSSNCIAFNVSPNCPDNHTIVLNTTITGSGETWESTITLMSYAPDLSVSRVIVNDGANGNLDPNESTVLQLSILNSGGADAGSFSFVLNTNYSNISINDDTEVTTVEAGESSTISFPVTVSSLAQIGDNAIFTLTINGTGYSNSDNFTLAIGIVQEDFESGNFDNLTWMMSGEADWTISTSAYEGNYSAQSGTIDHSESSEFSIDVDVTSADNISFYYNVSSESGYDYLRFYIDDVRQGQWAGIASWTQVSYPVTVGNHTFKWAYEKDSSESDGSDCAWVDNIVFPPCQIVVPEPEISVSPTSLDFGNVAIGATNEETFTISNTGTLTLSGSIVTPSGYSVQEITTRSKEHLVTKAKRNTVSYTILSGSSKDFRVIFAPTSSSCYNYDITINSNDLDTSTYLLPVSGCGSTIEASVNPTSMDGSMNIGQTASRNLVLFNSGNLEMTYSVNIVDHTRNSGGPDNYGYTWQDSNEPDGPDFLWITPNTANEIVGLDDDSAGSEIPIGFSFPFYENTYNSLYVNSNGHITFGSGSTSLANVSLPNSSEPNNMIAWFWDDMNPTESNYVGHVYYQNQLVNGMNAFIISFQDYMEYDGTSTPDDCIQAQVILFENGKIRIQYDYVGSSLDLSSETIGIENSDGTDGLTVASGNAGVTITDNYVVEFTNSEAIPEWLAVSPISGLISSNSADTLNVSFDMTGLSEGLYQKDIKIATNDPNNPIITVPVSISVGLSSEPIFSIDTNSIDFGNIIIGNTETETITISNSGGAILSGTIITPYAYVISNHDRDTNILSRKKTKKVSSSDKHYLQTQERNTLNYNVNPGESTSFDVEFTPLNAVAYNGNITITSNDVNNQSNYISVSGYGVTPDIDVTPTSITVDSLIETITNRTFHIANNGNYDLTYNVSLENTTRGAGGPDTFGYSWIDSNEMNGPVYSWIDISTTGTALSLNDDDYTEETLPFSFEFYGNTYNSIYVGSNGLLSFGTGTTNYEDTHIPNSEFPNNIICPLWNDLKPTGTIWGTVYSQTINGNYVVQYENVSHWDSSTPTDPVTFEVVLYPNGSILFQYESVGTQTDHHIGIENYDGTDGLQIAASGYTSNGLAVLIQNSTGNPWISCSSTSGTIAPGAGDDLTVSFDTNNLDYGVYNMNLVITSNDPDESVLTIPCTLNYSSAQVPVISIDNTEFDFGSTPINGNKVRTLTISNQGNNNLIGTLVTPACYSASIVTKQFIRNSLNFDISSGNSVMYEITFSPLGDNIYNGSIVISNNDISNPTLNIPVTGTGYTPADIEINPESLYFSSLTNNIENQSLTITNVGGEDLSYFIAIQANSGVLLDENFDSGLPSDWQIIDGAGTGYTWVNRTDYNSNSIDDTGFMFIDSDQAGAGVNFDDELITPTIPCSGAQSLYLDFDQYYNYYSSGGEEKADVDVWNGTEWVNVLAMSSADYGAWSTPDHQSIDISEYANNSLKVRFRYYDAEYDWFWAMDNVVITATGGVTDWLTIDNGSSVSGTITPRSNYQINIEVNTTGLEVGNYNKNILLTSNDIDESSITIPVTLTVIESQNNPSWNEEVAIYPNNTATVYCEVNIDGIPASTGDEIGAFVDEECRGYGEITLVSRNNAYTTLLIQTSGTSEIVNFQIYDTSSDEIYDIENTVTIVPGVVIGNASQPQILNAITTIPIPQNLTLNIEEDILVLSWTVIPSATGYKVYFSGTEDFIEATYVTVTTNSWSVSVSDKVKYYRVAAVKEEVTKRNNSIFRLRR